MTRALCGQLIESVCCINQGDLSVPPKSMQSYLPAKNAECAVSYANYATRSTSSAPLRPPRVCVCWRGVWSGVCVCVLLGNQAASRSAAIKARDPTKWKSNCIVYSCLSSGRAGGALRNNFFLPSHWIQGIYCILGGVCKALKNYCNHKQPFSH